MGPHYGFLLGVSQGPFPFFFSFFFGVVNFLLQRPALYPWQENDFGIELSLDGEGLEPSAIVSSDVKAVLSGPPKRAVLEQHLVRILDHQQIRDGLVGAARLNLAYRLSVWVLGSWYWGTGCSGF